MNRYSIAMVRAIVAAAALGMLASASSGFAQSNIEGVWQGTEFTAPGQNGPTIVKSWRHLLIFTKKHYSTQYETSDKSRPAPPEQNATDAQKAAAWEKFVAESGTYELEGSIITRHPLVSKDPRFMAPGAHGTWEFKIEGNTLWLTPKTTNGSPARHPITIKHVRVE